MIRADLLCLSHLRWNSVFQRPQHLMTRFAAHRRVYVLEEPVVGTGFPFLAAKRSGSVIVLTPQLPRGIEGDDADIVVRQLLRSHLREHGIVKPVHWFYTAKMLPIVEEVPAAAIAYDCMDEPSALAGSPPELVTRERALVSRADVVFTDRHSLFERKRQAHAHVYAFPSSVDVTHFARARHPLPDPDDQRDIPRPRLGFYGVIDDRLDLALLDSVARLRPEWHFVMIGPFANVDPASMPRHPNIHYLGMTRYDGLPHYLAGWDVAVLPFARNESTRHVSATKTPAYLAAGRPVVSTSVRNVVRPYGDRGLVRIADTADAFVVAVGAALIERTPPPAADAFLSRLSWDRTWADMNRVLEAATNRRLARTARMPLPRQAGPRSGAINAQLAGEA